MDTPRLTPSWQRWYFSVAVVFWTLALCAMVAATAWALLGRPGTAWLFTALGGVMIGVLLFWQSWICPWCRAGDGPSGHVESPQRELRDLHFTIWLPPISLATVSLLIWVGEPVLRQHLQAYFHWWRDTDQLVMLLLVGLAPLTLWSYVFGRLVSRRFRRRTTDMRVCFDCGYDLQGSPGPACPECGRVTIPQAGRSGP